MAEFHHDIKLVGKHDNLLHLPYQIGTYCGALAWAKTSDAKLVSKRVKKIEHGDHNKCMACYVIHDVISSLEILANNTSSKKIKLEAKPINLTTAISILPVYNKKNKRGTMIVKIRDLDFSKGDVIQFRINVNVIKTPNVKNKLQLHSKSKRKIIVLFNNLI